MFVCAECGYSTVSWMGKCPSCQTWNSLKDFKEAKSKKNNTKVEKIDVISFSDITESKTKRIKTGMFEFDRVLGNGFVEGEIALLSGAPGIGKSTLLLQALQKLKTLYISGEESASQVFGRAKRLHIPIDSFSFSSETSIESILMTLEEDHEQYEIIVIDSIQTIRSDQTSYGTTAQIRDITYQLARAAKKYNIVILIVGHITKEGDIAGPKLLEHIVDAVFLFEGDKISQSRILRAQKNRFGSTDEIGIFEMTEDGLSEIHSSYSFFEDFHQHVPGKSIAGIIEGNRPLFIEIQSLVVDTSLSIPRRVVKGLDYNKTLLLLAVLKKQLRLAIDKYDVFVNVIGGIDIKSPMADLAIVASILSSLKNKPLAQNHVFSGEVGLLGEVRKIKNQKRIDAEAKRMNFTYTYSQYNTSSIISLYNSLFK